MFSNKGNKRPHSDTISSSFLDEFASSKCENELPSFLFNMSAPKDGSLFKTPEINRNVSRASNQSTPLIPMPLSVEKSNCKTPPAVCLTSTPKRVEAEELNMSEILQGEHRSSQPIIASPKAKTAKKQIKMDAPFGDSFLQNQSSILNPDDVRPIGAYTISMLEEEHERLLIFVKEGREKKIQEISSIIQEQKDRVDRLACDLESMLGQRFQTIDHYLQEAIENFEYELRAGKDIEAEVHELRQRINAIVNMHLQTPTKHH